MVVLGILVTAGLNCHGGCVWSAESLVCKVEEQLLKTLFPFQQVTASLALTHFLV